MNTILEPMPGAWACDKCHFILQKNVLHASDGAVSADMSLLNVVCPNDGQLMRPLTWREANEELYERAVKEIARSRELEAQLSRAKQLYEDALKDAAAELKSRQEYQAVAFRLQKELATCIEDRDAAKVGIQEAGMIMADAIAENTKLEAACAGLLNYFQYIKEYWNGLDDSAANAAEEARRIATIALSTDAGKTMLARLEEAEDKLTHLLEIISSLTDRLERCEKTADLASKKAFDVDSRTGMIGGSP